ncbi:hypothetical protein H4582DRAFT_2074606 [Lactarius indigo]|nr:hypothetical protein H4582DRAFT_2074606 [Lactarius indigo]
MYTPGPHQFSLLVCQTTSASLLLDFTLLLPSSHPSYLTTVYFVSEWSGIHLAGSSSEGFNEDAESFLEREEDMVDFIDDAGPPSKGDGEMEGNGMERENSNSEESSNMESKASSSEEDCSAEGSNHQQKSDKEVITMGASDSGNSDASSGCDDPDTNLEDGNTTKVNSMENSSESFDIFEGGSADDGDNANDSDSADDCDSANIGDSSHNDDSADYGDSANNDDSADNSDSADNGDINNIEAAGCRSISSQEKISRKALLSSLVSHPYYFLTFLNHN